MWVRIPPRAPNNQVRRGRTVGILGRTDRLDGSLHRTARHGTAALDGLHRRTNVATEIDLIGTATALGCARGTPCFHATQPPPPC